MLGPMLFLISVLFLTATVAIAGIGAFARASIQNAATTVMQTALSHAVEAYQLDVAAQIRAEEGTDPASYQTSLSGTADVRNVPALAALQNPDAIPALAPIAEQISSYFVTEVFANTTAVPPSCAAPNPQAPAPDVATFAQCSPWVSETRMSGSVTVTVYAGSPTAPNPTVLAQRVETVTFRLFADEPFVSIVGIKDGDARDPTVDDVNAASPHEGDVGGYAPSSGPLDTSGNQPAGDTTIHLYYECHDPANNPCPGTPFPAGDQPVTLRWQNGNATQ